MQPIHFHERHIRFIWDECKLSKQDIEAMDVNALDQLSEECFHIEVEESSKACDSALSERGKLAVEIVDLINGPYVE
jgi:hypothetical protein